MQSLQQCSEWLVRPGGFGPARPLEIVVGSAEVLEKLLNSFVVLMGTLEGHRAMEGRLVILIDTALEQRSASCSAEEALTGATNRSF